MQNRTMSAGLVGIAALALAIAGCGSSSSSSSSSKPKDDLGGAAPASLVGTFSTTIDRSDAAGAPKPEELPIGPWTLVIGNSGGPDNSRALGVGNGDTDRVVYRFGVKGNVLSIRCNDDQGLPSAGSQSYLWSTDGTKLTLKPRSAGCKSGDLNNPVILSSHPWLKQASTVLGN